MYLSGSDPPKNRKVNIMSEFIKYNLISLTPQYLNCDSTLSVRVPENSVRAGSSYNQNKIGSANLGEDRIVEEQEDRLHEENEDEENADIRQRRNTGEIKKNRKLGFTDDYQDHQQDCYDHQKDQDIQEGEDEDEDVQHHQNQKKINKNLPDSLKALVQAVKKLMPGPISKLAKGASLNTYFLVQNEQSLMQVPQLASKHYLVRVVLERSGFQSVRFSEDSLGETLSKNIKAQPQVFSICYQDCLMDIYLDTLSLEDLSKLMFNADSQNLIWNKLDNFIFRYLKYMFPKASSRSSRRAFVKFNPKQLLFQKSEFYLVQKPLEKVILQKQLDYESAKYKLEKMLKEVYSQLFTNTRSFDFDFAANLKLELGPLSRIKDWVYVLQKHRIFQLQSRYDCVIFCLDNCLYRFKIIESQLPMKLKPITIYNDRLSHNFGSWKSAKVTQGSFTCNYLKRIQNPNKLNNYQYGHQLIITSKASELGVGPKMQENEILVAEKLGEVYSYFELLYCQPVFVRSALQSPRSPPQYQINSSLFKCLGSSADILRFLIPHLILNLDLLHKNHIVHSRINLSTVMFRVENKKPQKVVFADYEHAHILKEDCNSPVYVDSYIGNNQFDTLAMRQLQGSVYGAQVNLYSNDVFALSLVVKTILDLLGYTNYELNSVEGRLVSLWSPEGDEPDYKRFQEIVSDLKKTNYCPPEK